MILPDFNAAPGRTPHGHCWTSPVRLLFAARVQHPTLTPNAVSRLSLLFVTCTLIVGLSWLSFLEPASASLVMLDVSFGIENWGALLTGGALLYVAASVSRRHFAVWAAHAFLTAVFLGISVTVGQSILEAGAGAYHLALPLIGFGWHAYISRFMRPLPPQGGVPLGPARS